MTLSLTHWYHIFVCYDYNDYNDDNDYNDYNYYKDSDLDLDWERFSELVIKSDTINYYWQIAKLESWHWGLVIYNQSVTWTAFAILAMFLEVAHYGWVSQINSGFQRKHLILKPAW